MTMAMSTMVGRQEATRREAIDQAVSALRQGAVRLATSTLVDRIALASACVEGVALEARGWVEAACRAKDIPSASPARAEEVLGGPATVLRYLRLILGTMQDIQSSGKPRLPGVPQLVAGQLRVPVFPTSILYDSIVFRPMTAETWLQPGTSADRIWGDNIARMSRSVGVPPRVALVLGAGNVSAIPVTDVLTKIFQEDCCVLLKMNPINDYLGEFIQRALQPLIAADWLRLVYGGIDEGSYAVHHPQIDTVHITGSIETHDAIVWGASESDRGVQNASRQPLISKPITSELGNVTPWVIVPGDYSDAQLRAQAESIVASITNNASFNCITTKMIVTWRHWPARKRFLDLVASILQSIPARMAYYPGAIHRFARFAGPPSVLPDAKNLPWTLRRGVEPDIDGDLFSRESFVCVTAETMLDASSPREFLDRAVQFMNERIWGTLAVAITVPPSMQYRSEGSLDAAIAGLRYGTIGINQWPGVAYGLMSPPWGAFPEPDLSKVQSGVGFVHNTYLLDSPCKTVLRSPLSLFPKPVWFSTHRRPEAVAWKLCALYRNPSLWRLPALFSQALRG